MLVNLSSTTMPKSDELQQALNSKFLSKDKFAEDIEALVLKTKMNYIDAVSYTHLTLPTTVIV